MFEWAMGLVLRGGILGVFAVMTLENIFPFIPSELIMPLAGFLAAQGRIGPVAVVLAGTAGSIIGAVAWYYAGRAIGLERTVRFAERHGRWLMLSTDEVRRAERWVERYGAWAVLIGRALPGVRGIIAIPAGIAGMGLWTFVLSSGLGSLIWCALLTAAGYLLQAQYSRVEHWLNPVSLALAAVCAAFYLYRVATFRPSRSGRSG